MRHSEAWPRLPDLLDERDDPGLLAHVRTCADCQRQLFLLGRVDRLLRATPAAGDARARRRRRAGRTIGLGAAVAAAAAAALGTLSVLQGGSGRDLTFRTGSGRAVGSAVLSRSDARNVSLALTARALPVGHGQVFVLWAGNQARAPLQVGQFMVDRGGGCRVRFNLPADRRWSRFWITRTRAPTVIIARA